jgi:alcohol dehydrogenase
VKEAMRALVYHGPGQNAWEEAADPEILDDGDVIVRVDATTICGTDLHILKGDVPAVRKGRILGHEAAGTVWEAGGGWVLGHKVDGTQAEFVRVLYADNSMFHIPDGVSDSEALMLADILPTGYEVGVLAGAVRPGDVVAVVGTGPVGLAAIATARLYSPSRIVAIGLSDARLEAAKRFGADVTVNSSREDPLAAVKDLTGRLGADVAIEAVGAPAAFELAVKLARPGGRIANIGVHGEPVALHLEEQWIRDITITTGLVDTSSTPTLLRLLTTGQLDAKPFITHHFDLDDFEEAYDVVARAAETGALKVALTRGSE